MSNKSRFKNILDEIDNTPPHNPTDHLMIVDGLNMFLRVFAMIPSLNDHGDHVGGVIGFLKSLGYCLRTYRPTRCIIVFDGSGGSQKRRKIYPQYKNNRINKMSLNRHDEFENIVDEQQSMKIQIQRLLEYLNVLPVSLISIDNIEADDVIGYITSNLKPSKTVIVSSDKDFLQLVDERVSVWRPSEKVEYDPAMMIEKFGIHPNNYLLYRQFSGDNSDNITGVKGVGLKSLIKRFPMIIDQEISVDDIVNICKQEREKGSKLKIYENIINSVSILERNKKLMDLSDVDISGQAKRTIREIYNTPSPKLNPIVFRKMFVGDKLHLILPSVISWLNDCFTLLDFHARN